VKPSEVSKFYDVKAKGGARAWTVYRFPGTEKGWARAKEYARAYNASLMEAMGLSEADLTLKEPNHQVRPDEFDQAFKAEVYRGERAVVSEVFSPPIVGDDDPLPDTYPHDY
jgi:hypothetical protein